MFLVVAACLESTTFLYGRYGILRSRGSFLLSDPHISIPQSEIENCFAIRNPVLGWPTLECLRSDRHETGGARPSPAHPNPGPATVSLHDDSFTYASDVDDEHAWGNVLSRLSGHRIANYGVPGHGPDRTFPRFRENVDDEAEIVVLGFIGDDIIRIINQDRRLIHDQDAGMRLKS